MHWLALTHHFLYLIPLLLGASDVFLSYVSFLATMDSSFTPQDHYYSFQYPGYHGPPPNAIPSSHIPATPIPPAQFYQPHLASTHRAYNTVTFVTPETEFSRRKRRQPDPSATPTASKRQRTENRPPTQLNHDVAPQTPSTRHHPFQHENLRVSDGSSRSQAVDDFRSVAGVGPILANSESAPTQNTVPNLGSLSKSTEKSTTAATDVWYCTMRAVAQEKPAAIIRPSRSELYKTRPKDTKFVACRLCKKVAISESTL
jgi:hypothetical protein